VVEERFQRLFDARIGTLGKDHRPAGLGQVSRVYAEHGAKACLSPSLPLPKQARLLAISLLTLEDLPDVIGRPRLALDVLAGGCVHPIDIEELFACWFLAHLSFLLIL
jgi:hypothetical protein